MTKAELIEENERLLENLKIVEKELDARADRCEMNKQYEINNLLREHIVFYQRLLINLTENKKEEKEGNDW